MAKCLSRTIDNAVREAEPANAQPIQHLRRFVKYEHLPEHLRREMCIITLVDPAKPKSGLTLPLASRLDGAVAAQEKEEECLDEVAAMPSNEPALHLLVCATSDLAFEPLQALLASIDSSTGKDTRTTISKIIVPALAPTSEAQARQWSQQYWPTIYKKHNPFGAHPAIIARAAVEMEEKAGDYVDLARQAGKEASDSCMGEDIGVVIVDRSKSGGPSIAMVAGDARWNYTGKRTSGESGNVMAHAVMRAIGLIARKRQAVSTDTSRAMEDAHGEAFTDESLTPAEQAAYAHSSIEPGGYLCLDLEVYITHEPCVMCSMALLHSRVGRVIFEKRMPCTGALTAGGEEGQGESTQGLGYGLFWRPSLNWKFLAWQWTRDSSSPSEFSKRRIHA